MTSRDTASEARKHAATLLESGHNSPIAKPRQGAQMQKARPGARVRCSDEVDPAIEPVLMAIVNPGRDACDADDDFVEPEPFF